MLSQAIVSVLKLRYFRYDQIWITRTKLQYLNLYVPYVKQPYPNDCTIFKLHTISFQMAYNVAVCTVGQ